MHILLRVALAAMIVMSALGPKLTQAEDAIHYSTVGYWTIKIDPSMERGCFVMTEFVSGAALRLGFDLAGDTHPYVMFGHPKWQSIEYGKEYRIQVQFGDEPEWAGTAIGFSFDPPEDQPILSLDISAQQGTEFVFDFMKELFVVVRYNEKEILRLSLKDSYKAGSQLIECQAAANQETEDPFEETSSGSDDPFQ